MKALGKFNVLLFLILIGCKSTIHFDKSDYEWIDTYNVGDEIRFRSPNSDSVRTLRVIKKEFNFNYDTFSKFEYFDLYVYDTQNENESILLRLTKGTNGETRCTMDLFNATTFIVNIKNVKCKKIESKECIYEIKVKSKKLSSHDPTLVLWAKGKGIISYKALNGQIWTVNN